MAYILTKNYDGFARQILSELRVSAADNAQLANVTALWDTGATICVITKNTAARLQLIPIDIMSVQHAGGVSRQNVYLVDLYFSDECVIKNIKATECPDIASNFEAIIGMNIITCGAFSLTNVDGNSVFSFRLPSDAVELASKA